MSNESAHGYVGVDVITGTSHGKTFRQARGWMRYAMTVFDDTEVTIACIFVGSEGATLRYELVVEDSVVASRTYSSPAASPTVVEIPVPLSITKGRTNIAVTIRAHGGLTPALSELRTVQDHNEEILSSHLQYPYGAVR